MISPSGDAEESDQITEDNIVVCLEECPRCLGVFDQDRRERRILQRICQDQRRMTSLKSLADG